MKTRHIIAVGLLSALAVGLLAFGISKSKHKPITLQTNAYNSTTITKTNETTYEITQHIQEVGNTTADSTYRINNGKITITANTQNTTQIIVKQEIIQIKSGSMETTYYDATNTTTISVTNINNISYINYTYGNYTYMPTLRTQIELQLNIYNTTNTNVETRTITFIIDDAISLNTLTHITNQANDNNIQFRSLINNYTTNYTEGQTEGYNTGYATGYNVGETAGYTNGFTNGYNDGQTAGYNTGYTAGETAGYQTGYTEGETAGYNTGYGIGYNDSDAFNHPIDFAPMILNILTMPFTFISQAFDVTLWPGTQYQINIGNFIKAMIAISAILFIIRLFTSGFSIIGNYTGQANNNSLKRSQTKLNKAKTQQIKQQTNKKE